jgi:hypothetical protein
MSEEICDGVKMLLDRMKNNPEDFEYGGKLHGYRNTMEEVLNAPPAHQPLWFLNETEKKALSDGYRDMHKQVFTTKVVQAILAPEPEYDINMDQPYRNRSNIITPQHMIKDVTDLLNEEFDKQYAKNSNV